MSETIVFIDVSLLARILNLSGRNGLDALVKDGEKIFFSTDARLELDNSTIKLASRTAINSWLGDNQNRLVSIEPVTEFEKGKYDPDGKRFTTSGGEEIWDMSARKYMDNNRDQNFRIISEDSDMLNNKRNDGTKIIPVDHEAVHLKKAMYLLQIDKDANLTLDQHNNIKNASFNSHSGAGLANIVKNNVLSYEDAQRLIAQADAKGLSVLDHLSKLAKKIGASPFELVFATAAISLAFADDVHAGEQELQDQAVGLGLGAGIGLLALATAFTFPVSAPFIGAVLTTLGILGAISDWQHLQELWNNADFGLDDWFDPIWDDYISPLFNQIFDPLVLDLDGDGIELTALDGSDVYFDLSGDGRAERTGWVRPDDGLLAIDLNGNGTVDGIGELFGSSQSDGFAQLERLDTNGDGVIDASDDAFSQLRVWRDLNQNGVSDDGELITLEEAGITSISLSSTELGVNNNGHTAAREAVFSFADGRTGSIQSIFFQTDNQDTILDNTPDFTIDPDVANLPQLKGSGEIHSIGYVATNDAIFAADWQALTDNADSLSYTSLRQQFSNLLLRWAGVENVIEGSRGPNVDAQHLAFVEKFFGSAYQEIYAGGVLQNFPSNQEFGGRVEASFQSIVDVLLSMFSAQVALSVAKRSDDIFDFMAHDFFPNAFLQFSDEIPDDADASATLGNVGGVVQLIAETTPENHGEAVNHIEKSFAMLNGMIIVAFGGDRSAYEGAVAGSIALIANDGVRKIAEAIVRGDAAFGTDAAEGIGKLTGDNVFSGGAGDDLLVSGDGSDAFIYRTGDGSDYIRDMSTSLDDVDVLELTDKVLTDLSFERVADNLIIQFADSDENITVEKFFRNWGAENRGIDLIRLADGMTLSREDIRARTITVAFENSETILDSELDDVIIGNELNNVISISEGSDTIIYSQGDGSDTIFDSSGDISEVDTLKLGDLEPNQVILSRQGNALIIEIIATGESVKDVNFFEDSASPDAATGWNNHGKGIDKIEFANGVSWDRQTIADRAVIRGTDGKDSIGGSGLDDTIEGGALSDLLGAGAGSDTYLWSKGDGSDTISDNGDEALSADRVVLSDVSAGDVSISRLGDNLRILVNSTGEVITVYSQFSHLDDLTDETNNASIGIEALEFSNGVVWDRAILAQKTAQNSIGKDVYTWFFTETGSGFYKDEFGNKGDIKLLTSPNSEAASSGGSSSSGSGSTTVSTSYVDAAFGDLGSKVNLHELSELDTELLINTGVYGIHDIGLGSARNEFMTFVEGVNIFGLDDNNLEALKTGIAEGTNSSSSSNGGGDSTFSVDGFDIDIVGLFDTIGSNVINGGSGYDLLFGGLGNDYISGDDGNDALFGDEASTSGSGEIGLDILDGGDGDDQLYGGAGVDTLIGGEGSDKLYGGDDDDFLKDSSAEDDIFVGGRGDDFIQSSSVYGSANSGGGNGNDTFIYSRGDGNDTIFDGSHSNDEVDQLVLTDILSSEVEMGSDYGSDSVFLVDLVTASKIVLDGFLWSYDTRSQGVDEIQFADGVVWDRDRIRHESRFVRGTSKGEWLQESENLDNIFIGEGGDDIIVSSYVLGSANTGGDNGNDTFIYNRGDGNDQIFDGSHSTVETDKLVLSDINVWEVELSKYAYNDNIAIKDLITGQTISLLGELWNFDSTGQGIDEIEFSDGTVWQRSQIRDNAWIRGSVVSETLQYWNSSDDTFFGNLGDDYIISAKWTGGANGGQNTGDDTFIYRSGDGNDQIFDGSHSLVEIDTLKLIDINPEGIRLSLSDTNLEIKILSTGETIIDLGAWWHRDSVGQGIDAIEFADGEIWNRDDITYWAQGGASFYSGTQYDDTIIGSYLDQSLHGLAGDDVVEAGGGSDSIFGDGGDDTLKVSVLENGDLNRLDGGEGNDTVDFGDLAYAIDLDLVRNDGEALTSREPNFNAAGSSTFAILTSIENVIGSNFDDILSGNLENNEIEGGSGSDIIDGRSGNDRLDGGEGDDELIGYLGNDILEGGVGDDRLNGGLGDDLYIYNLNDGRDTIIDSGSDSADIIRLGEGIAFSDISLNVVGSNLEIYFNEHDSITIENWSDRESRVEYLEFADGTKFSLGSVDIVDGYLLADSGLHSKITAQYYEITSNVTSLSEVDWTTTVYEEEIEDINFNTYSSFWSGGPTNNFAARYQMQIQVDVAGTYRFSTTSDDGSLLSVNDSIIVENDGTHGSTRREGETYLEVGVHSVQIDYFESAGGARLMAEWAAPNSSFKLLEASDTPTGYGKVWHNGSDEDDSISGAGQDDILSGANGNDSLFGLAGNDVLNGGDGADIIRGGLGDDSLEGGLGEDRFIYELGGGADTIADFDLTSDKIDLSAVGLNFSQLVTHARDTSSGVLLNLSGIVGAGQFDQIAIKGVTVAQLLSSNFILSAPTLDNALSDQSYVEGESVSFTLPSGAFSDADGDNLTLTSKQSDGNPLPSWLSFDGANFTGTPPTGSAGTLSIQVTASDGTYNVSDVFDLEIIAAPALNPVNGTAGDDGNGNPIYGTSANDEINAMAGDDVIKASAGDDIIYGGDGNDYLDYEGIGTSRVNFTFTLNDDGSVTASGGSFGSDILHNVEHVWFEEEDTVYTIEHLVASGNNITSGANVVTGTTDDDGNSSPIYGTVGNDVINALAGDDVIKASAGNDWIYGGNGNDYLDYEGAGTTHDNFTFTDNGNGSITVTGSGFGTDILYHVENVWFEEEGKIYSVQELVALGNTGGLNIIDGTSTNDYLTGTSRNDILRGFDGDDVFYGSVGNDTFEGGTGYNQVNYDGAAADYTFIENSDGSVTATQIATGKTDKLADIGGFWFNNESAWYGMSSLSQQETSTVNTINGTTSDQIMVATLANDTFTFAADMGHDVVGGFTAGSGSNDVIEIQGLTAFDTYAEVLAAATDDGVDTTIMIDANNSITLNHVQVSDLHQDDFRFV